MFTKLSTTLALTGLLGCGVGGGGGLTIQALGSDVTQLTEGGTAHVRAVVTGPVAAGQLEDSAGAIVANFALTSGNTFEADLHWDDAATGTFHASRKMDLTARFYSGSARASAPLAITLECGSTKDLCDRRCVDLRADLANCGACGSKVDAGQICAGGTSQCNDSFKTYCPGAGCVDLRNDANNCGMCGNKCGNSCWFSQCHALTACFDSERMSAPRTCAEACQREGKACWDLCTDHASWADGGGVSGCLADPASNVKLSCGESLVGKRSASCCCRE